LNKPLPQFAPKSVYPFPLLLYRLFFEYFNGGSIVTDEKQRMPLFTGETGTTETKQSAKTEELTPVKSFERRKGGREPSTKRENNRHRGK
jgi:hypothetical protein